MTVMLVIVVSLVVIGALLWLLFGNRPARRDLAAAALDIKKLLPVHCQHFPQVHPILKDEDQEFMRRRAPQEVASRWRAERRRVLRLYIRGLGEDFRGLERLARLIAALSPRVERKQELEWLWLGIQFRFLYQMTLLRFMLHWMPSGDLIRLTEMLSELAVALERSINSMTESFPQAQSRATS
jgi:hypothetical protein